MLHIGTGKTGSTTLQTVLYTLFKKGDMDSIHYPVLNNKKHHNQLCTLVMPHERIRRDIRTKFRADDEVYRAFVNHLKSNFISEVNGHKNVLLSGEYFCGFSYEEVKEFKKIINQMGFNKVKVVVYFREVCSLYLSQIQQRIKGSSTFASPNSYKFNYRSIYERWHSEFSDVEVREFSADALVDGDIVSDFLDVTNKFFGTDIVRPIELNKSNESLSTAAMLVIKKYRERFYPEDDNILFPDSNKLTSLLSQISSDKGLVCKPRLKDSVKSLIRFNNKSDIEWLNEKFGIDFAFGSELNKPVENIKFENRVEDVLKLSDQDSEIQNQLLLEVANYFLKQNKR